MVDYDLTPHISYFLDWLLQVFLFFEFLSVKKTFKEQHSSQGKVGLLCDANMVDLAVDVYKNLHSDGIPRALWEKEAQLPCIWHSFRQKQRQSWRPLKTQNLEDRCSQPRVVGSCLPTWKPSLGLAGVFKCIFTDVQDFIVSGNSRISLPFYVNPSI